MTPEQMARLVAGDFDCHDYVEINVGGTGPNEADFETLDTPGCVIRELATTITTLQQEKAALEGERDAAVKQTALWKTLGDSVRADAASAAIFIAEYVEKFSIKHPPKQDEGSPHHWHSLVFRMGERITEAEATTRRLEKELAVAEQEREAWMKEWARKGDRADRAKAESRRLREALEAASLWIARPDVPTHEVVENVAHIIDAALAGTPEGPS